MISVWQMYYVVKLQKYFKFGEMLCGLAFTQKVSFFIELIKESSRVPAAVTKTQREILFPSCLVLGRISDCSMIKLSVT